MAAPLRSILSGLIDQRTPETPDELMARWAKEDAERTTQRDAAKVAKEK